MGQLKTQRYPSWEEGDPLRISIEKFLKRSCRSILKIYDGAWDSDERAHPPIIPTLMERRKVIKKITEETCHTCIHRFSNGFSECKHLNNDYEGRKI